MGEKAPYAQKGRLINVKIADTTSYWDEVAVETEREESAKRVDKWRKVATNWLAHYAEVKARDFILDALENHARLDCNAKVLDIGCGPGKWVNLFAEKGFATTGVDSSHWMIRLAKKRIREDLRGLTELRVMNVAKLDLQSDHYDLVNCVTVLQHILNDEDWKHAVHNMVRVTRPLGHILIFEAAPSFVFKKSTRHLRFRAMQQYVNEFEKAGAQLIHWRATDLSFLITFLGLQKYAASFSKKVYYFFADDYSLLSPALRSWLSRAAVDLAKPIDYKLGETPLRFLSMGKIMLFRKTRT